MPKLTIYSWWQHQRRNTEEHEYDWMLLVTEKQPISQQKHNFIAQPEVKLHLIIQM